MSFHESFSQISDSSIRRKCYLKFLSKGLAEWPIQRKKMQMEVLKTEGRLIKPRIQNYHDMMEKKRYSIDEQVRKINLEYLRRSKAKSSRKSNPIKSGVVLTNRRALFSQVVERQKLVEKIGEKPNDLKEIKNMIVFQRGNIKEYTRVLKEQENERYNQTFFCRKKSFKKSLSLIDMILRNYFRFVKNPQAFFYFERGSSHYDWRFVKELHCYEKFRELSVGQLKKYCTAS